MKAMILSAGYGKRLHPLTNSCPKPLLKINGETLLSNTFNFLIKFGVTEAVVNVHYLSEKIVEYISKNKFNLSITIINEKEKILDTGGGILNAIEHFSNKPFLVINPDTIWNTHYIKELKMLEKEFLIKKQKCSMLVVSKKKSFDKNFKGDFDLNNNLINKKKLNYIYTGLQIIKPEVFSNIDDKVFSINSIWNKLIKNNELNGMISNINFLHVSTLDIYKELMENLNAK
jgi:MurNAc alpha-1-phosphate uridylyltransferase